MVIHEVKPIGGSTPASPPKYRTIPDNIWKALTYLAIYSDSQKVELESTPAMEWINILNEPFRLTINLESTPELVAGMEAAVLAVESYGFTIDVTYIREANEPPPNNHCYEMGGHFINGLPDEVKEAAQRINTQEEFTRWLDEYIAAHPGTFMDWHGFIK